jgi:pyruvate/2-oxoglutarate dehydrogenase complex dihydrolipoamide acyltransferase (E2) component
MPSPELLEIVLPDLGLADMEQRLSRWLKATGNLVVAEDPLLEILSAGVCITLPAPASGVLLAQFVNAGDAVQPGQHLGVIECAADEGE